MWNKIKQLYNRIRYKNAYNRLNELVTCESKLMDAISRGREEPVLVEFDVDELIDKGFNYDLNNFNLSALSREAQAEIINIIHKDRKGQLKKRHQLENITEELTELLNHK